MPVQVHNYVASPCVVSLYAHHFSQKPKTRHAWLQLAHLIFKNLLKTIQARITYVTDRCGFSNEACY